MAIVDVFLQTGRLVGAASRSPLPLVPEWTNGSTKASGSFPDNNNADIRAYAIINRVIYGVGLGLVALGHRIRTTRATRRKSLDLTPA